MQKRNNLKLILKAGFLLLTLAYAVTTGDTKTANASSGAPVEIHLNAAFHAFNNISTGIADGNTGVNDINSFGTPSGQAPLNAQLPAAVAFSFDGSGFATEASTPYIPLTLDAGRTILPLNDDDVSVNITLPFSVRMYNRNNDAIKISSNGFIYLNQTTVAAGAFDSMCCQGQSMSAFTSTNDHTLAGTWTDLYPPGNGEISYQTLGVAPDRIFVVQFDNVSQCCDASGGNSFQVQLYELPLDPTAPGAISDLAANPGDQEVTLTWSEPNINGAPLTSYEVHYSNDGFATDDQTCVTTDCTDLTTGATVTGLTNGIEYSFRVYSYNSIGISPVSNTATATPDVLEIQPAKWPTDTNPSDRVIANELGNERVPRTVITSSGDYITFFDGEFDTSVQIYAQKFSASTGATIWGSAVPVSTLEPNYSITNGDWEASSDGGAFVAWNKDVNVELPFDSDNFVQKIDANGNRLWGSGEGITITRDDVLETADVLPRLLNDGAGGVYVAWVIAPIITAPEIYITHLDSTGAVAADWNPLGTDALRTIHVEDGTLSTETIGLDMWMQADGNIAIPYYRNLSGEITAEMIVVQAQGGPSSSSILLSNTGISIGQFRAAPYGDYGVFAVFASNGDVYAQRVDDSWNKEWGATGVIASSADGDYLSVVPDSSGGILAIWNSYEDADLGGVYASHVLTNGTLDPSWGGDIAVAPAADGDAQTMYNSFDAIADGAGGAFVSFVSANNGNILLQQLNNNGVLSFSGIGYPLGAISTNTDYDPHLISDGGTGVVVTWTGENSTQDIYAQNVVPIPPGPVPEAITDLAGIPGDGQVTLNWTAPYDNGFPITDYIIQYDNGFGYQTFFDGTSTSTTVDVTFITNFSTLTFRVFAVNDNGQSATSNLVTVTPVPCENMSSNEEIDDNPLTTVSDQCLGASVLDGGLSLPYIPDSFSFPRKFSSASLQESFSNDNPATTGNVDVTVGPEDVLTASDLTGTSYGFNVYISASNFSNGTSNLPLRNLYVATTAPNTATLNALNPDLNGTPNNPNQLVYATGSTGLDVTSGTATLGDLNTTASYTTDGVSFDANEDDIADIITLMNGPNGTTHLLSASQALSFYLNIPASQPSGNYSILFTIDITSTS